MSVVIILYKTSLAPLLSSPAALNFRSAWFPDQVRHCAQESPFHRRFQRARGRSATP